MKTTFIAFDFETTGFSPKAAEIVEIGAVKFDAQGKVLGTFEQLVKPSLGINPDAQAVNGISEAMVAHCPSIAEVMPQFMLFIGAPEQNILIAHNASKFDIGFLAMGCARSGLPMPDHRIVDSIDLCRQCMPKPYNLRSVCQRLGIATGAHRALGDAMAVMRVVLRLGSRHPGAWQNLPFYYAEDFDVEIIDPPSEFEEWEECDDPTQEVEFVYNRGSRPGEVRRAIPQSFFECDGSEYMVGFCMRDGKLKTFDTFFMSDITVPEDTSETLEGFSLFQEPVKSVKMEGRTPKPNEPGENKPPPTDTSAGNFWQICFVVSFIVVLGGLIAFYAWLQEEVQKATGEDLAGFLLIGILVAVFIFICVFNTMNGLFDSMFGPRK